MRASSASSSAGGHEVGLVQEDHVREGDLFLHLVRIPVQEDVLGVHERHDAVDLRLRLHFVVHEERLRDRAGVGHAGRLDQDVVELVAPLHQVADDADEVAANGAADAPVVHLEDLFLGVDDQLLIDADLAELVLDDRDALAVIGGEDVVQKRRLPGSEKASQDGDGNARGRAYSHRSLPPWRGECFRCRGGIVLHPRVKGSAAA